MKIRNQFARQTIDIYAIYWIDGNTYFYGLPKGNGGLTVYKLEAGIDVIDPNLNGDFLYYKEGIFYKPLIEEKLLDDLLEYDETAYNRFLEILKAEGRIEPDFY